MNKELISIKERFEKYIKENKLKNFRVGVANGYEIWLIKKLVKPLKVNTSATNSGIFTEIPKELHISILESAARVDVKDIIIAIRTKNDKEHSNYQDTFYIDEFKFQECCVGDLAREKVDFDSMKQVFSLPERGAYTLRRFGHAEFRDSIYEFSDNIKVPKKYVRDSDKFYDYIEKKTKEIEEKYSKSKSNLKEEIWTA